ncbi:gluconokinase [Yonghaparkia sp. Root332]|uniref:gluconokinase n=1 Tax=Yonghaparkia sp. Root332 TaxID=1736516 RepID=UPI000A9FAA9C|nr:gluconokinase [Yonghaparkia sp. Root332]
MTLVVVMGVAGSGKSTVGALLAERLGAPFVDADALHSDESIAKMTRGEPLVDADRWPWLARVADVVATGREGRGVVIACSALRTAYRDAIRRGTDDVVFVHLAADESVLAARLQTRTGHFMPPALLASQLDALEGLSPCENGVTITASAHPTTIADLLVDQLT